MKKIKNCASIVDCHFTMKARPHRFLMTIEEVSRSVNAGYATLRRAVKPGGKSYGSFDIHPGRVSTLYNILTA